VLCLNIPSGCSSQFQASFIFQQTGYLHGLGKIQTITVLMPLITTILCKDALYSDAAYWAFYNMLSSDMIDLMSPVFRSDFEIDELFHKILELIVVHEGLFPITESLICWHQLLDIVFHIKNMGPIRGWWEFVGERALSTIKKDVPHGGTSFDKVIIRLYSLFERAKLSNAYRFTLYDFYSPESRTTEQQAYHDDINNEKHVSILNGKLQYSDDKFLLLKKIYCPYKNKKSLLFNEYELECLLKVFISEIKKQCCCSTEAYYRSPVYRMYHAFNYHQNKQTKSHKIFRTMSFLKFLHYLSSNLFTTLKGKSEEWFFKQFCRKKDVSYCVVLKEYMNRNKNCNDWEKITNETGFRNDGVFIEEDLYHIKALILNDFLPCKFSQAVVYGILMESKGEICAQRSKAEIGSLKFTWFEKKNISSWFKYRHSNVSTDSFGFDDFSEFSFGQFNYFFRVFLPFDSMLHGLPMASCVCRTAKKDEFMNTVEADHSSIVEDNIFVALTNVFSTRLLVGGRDIEGLPINLRKTSIK
jgi:hypothetical protein